MIGQAYRFHRLILSLLLLVSVTVAQPQSDLQAGLPALTSDDQFAGLSVRDVVREGNRRLLEGEADAALGAYDQAGKLLPDAREIAFGRGLANYDLKRFDEARAAFQQVAVEGTDALATDAQYGIGTCDHVEALENTDNPEMAISLLESAMRRYHRVLAENPHHQAALDANVKAASVWRRIKKMQEQREQQQSDDCEENGEDQEQDGEKKEKQESDENQDQRQKGNDDKESDKEQESDSSEDQKEEQPEQQSAEQKEQQVSREQAQRQLREMMQALRERKKARPRKVIKMPITPVDKDW